MIFHNPAGAPELACDQCGCRWFDRINDTCYECGTKVSAESIAEFNEAVERFRARGAARGADASGVAGDCARS
ncbi:cysteine protease [Aromatoleum toluvorans]|uniref:Cysteine protease n=1 Tax=Aromatoleum toluvorans TaxID=92002 RepID=A0ABX1PZR6_9RHOO|nr:cysteine protease [Aromatoleum toluvorans]NMG43749.1 cysteine protease [Aromatoleum toluvorans]